MVFVLLFVCIIYPNIKFYIDMLIVAEVIKSENKKDIIISWDKTWTEKSNVCLYDKDNTVLGEYNNVISRYLARTINPALYGI